MTKLSKGGKKVGVKWIYKTKFNENREVNKYNARLVANIVSILWKKKEKKVTSF